MMEEKVYVLMEDLDYRDFAIRAVCSTLELAMSRADHDAPWEHDSDDYWWSSGGTWKIERHSIRKDAPAQPSA